MAEEEKQILSGNEQKSDNIADRGGDPKESSICGIIRPISAMSPEYSESHWKEIDVILKEVIKEAGFEAKLVSDAAEVSVIQKNIVQNLYECPIVICDVSGKNANVMFELGLRLAFDKPTIIIKDDKTDYNFDTSVIEHLHYPKSLHYGKIKDFKKELAGKLKATYKIAKKDKKYSPFLKHFGQLIPAKIDNKEVSEGQFLQKNIQNLNEKVDFLIAHQNGIERKEKNQSEIFWRRRNMQRRQSDAHSEKLFLVSKLTQAQEELRHITNARAAADKHREIAELERLLLETEDTAIDLGEI